MRKASLAITLGIICIAAFFAGTFASEDQRNDNNLRVGLGIASVQGYWPISNSSTSNADVLTSPFGPRDVNSSGYDWDYHEGIDIQANFVPVYAAFSGTIRDVNSESDNSGDNTVERWVRLQHIDPENPSDPDDDTVFYTFYDHLQWYPQLEDLEDLEGNQEAMIDAGTISDIYEDPTTGRIYEINPFATSGDSGVPGNPHLHFAGLFGGIDPVNDAINPMRDDSLPYTNSAPTIQNIVLTTNPRRLSFRVSTHHRELDLNGITLFDGFDGVDINFDNRMNTDAAGSLDPNNRNEDGIINTLTSYNASITITITTHDFNPGTNQIMDFAFDLPTSWNLKITIHVDDTQELYDQEIVGGIVGDGYTLPEEYRLSQNFPNPFNPSTTIRFALPEKSVVSLAIFDISGRLVRELASQQFYEQGWQELSWDGKNAAGQPVASGMYYYHLIARSSDDRRNFSQTRKMLLIR